MDQKEFEEKLREFFAEKEVEKTSEPEYTAEDLTQLFEKIMQPKRDYGVVTKDLKTSNLDKLTAKKITIIKSIAKDFGVFAVAFDLLEDKWVNAVKISIDGDAEIMQAASQGLSAKLLDTFVTLKKESKFITKVEKEGGLRFR